MKYTRYTDFILNKDDLELLDGRMVSLESQDVDMGIGKEDKVILGVKDKKTGVSYTIPPTLVKGFKLES